MNLSVRKFFFLIFMYISTSGYIFAADKDSDTLDLDF